MIQSVKAEKYSELFRLLGADNARSYFIRLGLLEKNLYRQVFADFSDSGGLNGLLCQRKSGTLQFYSPGHEDVNGFASVMGELEWNMLISPYGCCKGLISAGLFEKAEQIAQISCLRTPVGNGVTPDLTPLMGEDLEEINSLYDKVFTHHMPLEQMVQKLSSGRGRGVVIRSRCSILCVAQTEFEERDSALIVGVATHPDYQRMGLAEACMVHLCRELQAEGRTPWLQYDNPAAGKLYEKIGFVQADSIMQCKPFKL